MEGEVEKIKEQLHKEKREVLSLSSYSSYWAIEETRVLGAAQVHPKTEERKWPQGFCHLANFP